VRQSQDALEQNRHVAIGTVSERLFLCLQVAKEQLPSVGASLSPLFTGIPVFLEVVANLIGKLFGEPIRYFWVDYTLLGEIRDKIYRIIRKSVLESDGFLGSLFANLLAFFFRRFYFGVIFNHV
jgi:hypothetical protein